jgi:hypothetical protein
MSMRFDISLVDFPNSFAPSDHQTAFEISLNSLAASKSRSFEPETTRTANFVVSTGGQESCDLRLILRAQFGCCNWAFFMHVEFKRNFKNSNVSISRTNFSKF